MTFSFLEIKTVILQEEKENDYFQIVSFFKYIYIK